MNTMLARLAGWKSGFLYALLQVRRASAALALRDHQAFTSIITGSSHGFTDPTRLTGWTCNYLYAHLAFVVVVGCIRALEAVGNPFELSPATETIRFVLRMIITYGIMLLLPAWTLRANHNARQLGASGMKFAPEWAAGWYFLPPGLFWKPYQVMKEVWQASVDPTDWRDQRGSPLVGWWWALWLIASWGGLLGLAIATLVLEASDAQTVEIAIGIANLLLHIPLTLLLLTIILKTHGMQMRHHDTAPDPTPADAWATGEGLPNSTRSQR